MRAAVLTKYGRPLELMDVDEPKREMGEAIVDIVAAPVLPYAQEVFGGDRPYGLPTPIIPGCGAIGRIREIGQDATRLKPGDWVFCDPTVRSRDDAQMPDIVLQGWDTRGDGGRRLQQRYLNGPFAEGMMLPTENLVPLGAVDAAMAARWCALNTLLIPFGGLVSLRFEPGETILVHGATGHFGSATVAVALAMGAQRVIAAGRNTERLADLRQRFGPRVVTAALTGEAGTDKALIEACADRIDCVFDFLPPSASAEAVRTAIMTVRTGGRIMLMGGVGTAGGADLALPYAWLMLNNIELRGQWMYAREVAPRLIGLIRAGLLDLHQFTFAAFGLDAANDALAHAAAHAGPFQMTLITP